MESMRNFNGEEHGYQMKTIRIPGGITRPPHKSSGNYKVSSKDRKLSDEFLVLVITPFDSNGDRIKKVVENALREIAATVLQVDSSHPGAEWVNAVTAAIKAANLIFVDISGHDPNLMYELGYAHALRQPTVLIKSIEEKPPPTNLQNHLYIPYDPANLEQLKNEIKQNVRRRKGFGDKR